MGASLQIDNPEARVTRWTLTAGEETGPHRHEHDYVVVPLAHARMRITRADGTQSTTELHPGSAYYRHAGAEHNVRNEEGPVVDFVEIELPRPRRQ